MSLAPGTDLTVADAAALLDAEQAGVAAALRRLVAAHLLDERTPGRYTFHDLLRLFAAGRSAADDPPAWRDAAVVGGTHRTAWLLADALRGHLHLSRYTTDWLTTARAALRSARGAGDLAGQAAAHHSLGTAYRSVTDHHAALEQYRAGCGWPAGPGGARPRRPRWATSASSTRSWAASTRRSDS